MKRAAYLVCLAAGCTVGAPPGFSSGDRWTFPLVAPLEEGVLVTPVFVNDKGPYLMAIDPDSPMSVVDDGIVSEHKLHNGVGPKMLDETDHHRPTHVAEVPTMKIGNLTVKQRKVMVMRLGFWTVAGRPMRGVLGRDIIADSLVFGFDRERGVAYLATTKSFTPPSAASAIDFGLITNRLKTEGPSPPGRRIATVQIGDQKFKMHLDLGAVSSTLRTSLWTKAALAPIPVQTELRDEVGTTRKSDKGGVANQVVAGTLAASGVLFAPFDDGRWEEEDIDGTLGLNFFRLTNVWAHWDATKFYVEPRGDVIALTKERISRWDSKVLEACATPGCITATVGDAPPGTPTPAAAAAPAAPAPAIALAPRPVLTIKRDPSAMDLELEVLLAAVGADGRPTELPMLAIHLPKGQEHMINQLDTSYGGHQIVVVDVSPFPRPCKHATGCLAAIAKQR